MAGQTLPHLSQPMQPAYPMSGQLGLMVQPTQQPVQPSKYPISPPQQPPTPTQPMPVLPNTEYDTYTFFPDQSATQSTDTGTSEQKKLPEEKTDFIEYPLDPVRKKPTKPEAKPVNNTMYPSHSPQAPTPAVQPQYTDYSAYQGYPSLNPIPAPIVEHQQYIDVLPQPIYPQQHIPPTPPLPQINDTPAYPGYQQAPTPLSPMPQSLVAPVNGYVEIPPFPNYQAGQQPLTRLPSEPSSTLFDETSFTPHSQSQHMPMDPSLFFANIPEVTDIPHTDSPPIFPTPGQADFEYQPADAPNSGRDMPDYDDYPGMSPGDYDNEDTPKARGNKAAIALIVFGILILGAVAFLWFSRSAVQSDQLVGTWTPPGPQLGVWVVRMEFNADGTGRRYHFDEFSNQSDNEMPFVWHLEGRNRLINTLWESGATARVSTQGDQTTLRFRFDGDDEWHEYRQVRVN